MRLITLMAFSVMVLALPGCETTGSPTKLSDTFVDSSFEKKRIRFRNSLGTPVYQYYYLKVFETEGKIALCGVAVQADGGFMDELWDRWLENAYVVINHRSDKIASARFMNRVGATERQKRARCIKSDRAAARHLLNGRAGLSGGSVTVFF